MFEEVRVGIREHVPEIMEYFMAATREEPWIHLPADFRLDALNEVIVHVAELALGGSDLGERVRRTIQSAATHGQERLRHGFPDALLFREYYMLRQSIWSYVREHHDANGTLAFEAVVRIDAAITLATKASIRGFHRPAFEAQERWPECLHQLEGEWHPLPPVA